MRLVPKKNHRDWYIKLQNLALASMIKEKNHILKKKKALKTLFHKKKNTTIRKAQKHFFLKNTCWEDCFILFSLCNISLKYLKKLYIH